MNPLADISDLFNDPQMLHAALAHLPIGLVVVGVPLLLWNGVRDTQSHLLDCILVMLYSIGSVLAYWAAHVGEQARAELPNILPAQVWEQVDLHSSIAGWIWILAAMTAAALLPAWLKQYVRIRSSARACAFLVGAATMLLALSAAHEGGKLVYVYGVGTPALEIQTHRADPATATSTPISPIEADDAMSQASLLSTPLTFSGDVQPIFTAYCVSCHNPSDAKSNLDLTTLAGLLEGGKKAGPALLSDTPELSPFLLYLTGTFQPQMPKDEPPLSAGQIALLDRWARNFAAKEIAEQPSVASSEGSDSRESRTYEAETPDAWSPAGFDFHKSFDASLSNTTDLRTGIRYKHLAATNMDPLSTRESGAADLHFVIDTHERLNRYQRYRRLSLVGPQPTVPTTGPELGNPIDRFIYDGFQKADIRGVELADDRDSIRRAYLDLLGVHPEFEEVERFVNDASEDKFEQLIDSLLERRSDYADHWVPQWEDALGSDPSEIFGEAEDRLRGDFRKWLSESFKQNRPLDEIVLDLFVTRASGFKGRYVLSSTRDDSVLSASDIAQVFLGEAMRCAACHNHFANRDLSLSRTLGFASYFSTRDLELIRCGKSSGQFLAPKLPFDLPEFDPGTPRSLEDRMEVAGLWLVDPTNDRFAQVMVNRIWKRYFGVGLYEPADDWRSEVGASHPELLRWLADDFRSGGFDVQRLVKLILTSRTYRHAFNNDRAVKFDQAAPDIPRYFESPAVRRLTAEQYWDSVRKVLGFEWQGEHRTFRIDPLPPLAVAMGRPVQRKQAETERNSGASVVQALLMLNDEKFNSLIAESPALNKIIDTLKKDNDRPSALRAVYRLVLSRDPNEDEQRVSENYYSGNVASTDPLQVPSLQEAFVRDTCWSLLTSPEFLFVP